MSWSIQLGCLPELRFEMLHFPRDFDFFSIPSCIRNSSQNSLEPIQKQRGGTRLRRSKSELWQAKAQPTPQTRICFSRASSLKLAKSREITKSAGLSLSLCVGSINCLCLFIMFSYILLYFNCYVYVIDSLIRVSIKLNFSCDF